MTGAGSTGLSASTILLLSASTAFPRATQHAFAFVGASLTANEWKDLYNAVRAYLVAFGAIVAGDYAAAT